MCSSCGASFGRDYVRDRNQKYMVADASRRRSLWLFVTVMVLLWFMAAVMMLKRQIAAGHTALGIGLVGLGFFCLVMIWRTRGFQKMSHLLQPDITLPGWE